MVFYLKLNQNYANVFNTDILKATKCASLLVVFAAKGLEIYANFHGTKCFPGGHCSIERIKRFPDFWVLMMPTRQQGWHFAVLLRSNLTSN